MVFFTADAVVVLLLDVAIAESTLIFFDLAELKSSL